jgi:hypothetical protein
MEKSLWTTCARDGREHKPTLQSSETLSFGELDAYSGWRTTVRNRQEEREFSVQGQVGDRRTDAEIGERRTDAPEHGTGDRQPDSDAQHHHDEVAFGVVAVLECAIPMVEHLHNRCPEAHGQKHRNERTSHVPTHDRDDSMRQFEVNALS